MLECHTRARSSVSGIPSKRQNTMARLELVEIGAVLEDIAGAIEIIQNGKKYRARDWRLTPEVVEIIHIALSHGLIALWTQGCPQNRYFEGDYLFGKGSHHLSFSRSHSSPWIIAVDGNATPPVPKQVVINKRYRDCIDRAGLPYEMETRGGKNILIRPLDLTEALSRINATWDNA